MLGGRIEKRIDQLCHLNRVVLDVFVRIFREIDIDIPARKARIKLRSKSRGKERREIEKRKEALLNSYCRLCCLLVKEELVLRYDVVLVLQFERLAQFGVGDGEGGLRLADVVKLAIEALAKRDLKAIRRHQMQS